jgi:hypothetical protein
MSQDQIDRALAEAVAQAAGGMAMGMLTYPDVEQVIADLKPNYVEMPAVQLANARAGFIHTRGLGRDGLALAAGQVNDATLAVRSGMPDLWAVALQNARSGNVENAANAIADLVVSILFAHIGEGLHS